jgi:hypothetical protein
VCAVLPSSADSMAAAAAAAGVCAWLPSRLYQLMGCLVPPASMRTAVVGPASRSTRIICIQLKCIQCISVRRAIHMTKLHKLNPPVRTINRLPAPAIASAGRPPALACGRGRAAKVGRSEYGRGGLTG